MTAASTCADPLPPSGQTRTRSTSFRCEAARRSQRRSASSCVPDRPRARAAADRLGRLVRERRPAALGPGRLDDWPGRGSGEKGDLQKEPPGGIFVEPADHGLGRSRGGLTSEIHLAVEQGQKPLSVVITAGSGATPRSSKRSGKPSEFRGWGSAGRASARTGCGPTRRTTPAAIAPTCADAGSKPPSRFRPGRQPPQARLARRAAAGVRQGRLQTAARGRVRDQPAQAPPGRRHEGRQTRRPLASGHDPVKVDGPSNAGDGCRMHLGGVAVHSPDRRSFGMEIPRSLLYQLANTRIHELGESPPRS
ncbi:hypothetical protein Strvi_6480 [Streptomyces violaceusniger Tu 4113]|uniref:Uncharacterized protein n=1 Tax=Streptomyces violaceusniger (strain Tu 4113) TaxID=653045 RepID=G2NVL6_STRV4|nr:hypothetical protein Strvi_6480 [Streptomyces violaceusniger Tu 4113]